MKASLRLGAFVVSAVAAAAMGQGIQVTVDGSQVNFRGQQPTMSGDRVMVPLRGVFERMGAKVDWHPENQTVEAIHGQTHVRLRIGETTASVNDRAVGLDVPAQIIGGSTMVPLRFIGEAFGDTVDWNAQQEMVMIATNGSNYRFPPNSGRAERVSRAIHLRPNEVIPVSLNDQLSSDSAHRGDRFTVTVQSNSAVLPANTTIEGYVKGVCRADNGRAGMLELVFDRLTLPGGSNAEFSGMLIPIEEASNRGGVLYARSGVPLREAFIGFGDGGRRVVGVRGNEPLSDVTARDLYGIGSFARYRGHDVNLSRGATMGVRIEKQVVIDR